jgi:hypothetical protein
MTLRARPAPLFDDFMLTGANFPGKENRMLRAGSVGLLWYGCNAAPFAG